MLLNIDKWGFQIFQLEDETGQNPLFYVAVTLFNKYSLFEKFNIDKEVFFNFMMAVQQGYKDENPYHNGLHGKLDANGTDSCCASRNFLTVLIYGRCEIGKICVVAIGFCCVVQRVDMSTRRGTKGSFLTLLC